MHSSLRAGLCLAGFLGLVAAGACGGNVVVDPASATGGHGGSSTATTTITLTTTDSTTTTVGVTTSSVGVTSSSSGTTDPCASGSDCTQCPDFNSCSGCLSAQFPQGRQLYEAAVTCILCDACYTVCDGPMNGCSSPPATKDACDVGTPSMPGGGDCGGGGGANMGCIGCAEQGPCAMALQACTSNTNCTDYANALSSCPSG